MTAPAQTGLAKVVDKIYGQPFCKKEQMSNWERRPLRQTQQHYAALDAYVLVDLIQRLDKIGSEKGQELSKFVKTLDHRHFKPTKAEDSDVEDFMTDKPQTTF